jgi:TldD protein
VDRRGLEAALEEAVAAARASVAHASEQGMVASANPVEAREETPYQQDPRRVPVAEKVGRMLAFEEAARKHFANRLVNTIVAYGDLVAEELTVNTAGTCIQRHLVRTSVNTHITAASNGQRQRGTETRAALAGYELVRDLEPEEFTIRAARQAVDQLTARPAPAGVFPVVFHPSITGLLTHEALGHNAEADGIWTGESILTGRLGDEIASPVVTVVDDPTLPGSYGSYTYDDEGTPAQRTVIIDGGRLTGYLHSLQSAARLDQAPNGHARADGFSYPPIVRMSNTFLAPGESGFEELLNGIDRGVYLAQGHWGYVFVEKGHFTCHASVSRLIEDGQLGELLRDVSVSGLTLEVLQDIDAVGSDFEMLMPGTCGKGGQGAAVNAGGPHLRVRRLVVGGQQTG